VPPTIFFKALRSGRPIVRPLRKINKKQGLGVWAAPGPQTWAFF